MSKFQRRVKYKYQNNVFEGTPVIAFSKDFPMILGMPIESLLTNDQSGSEGKASPGH